MNMKTSIYKYAAVLLCAALLSCRFFCPPAMAQEESPELRLNSQSAILMDGATGRVLYGKEEELARPMASTTKIMTCILALETCSLQDEVTVSSYAASQPKVRLGAPAGRRFCLEDVLHSLMLESHNDSAVAVAEHVAGSVEGFAGLMNKKAREIGCGNTWFITPNGLDAQERTEDGTIKIHSTTAKDLASMMSYCAWKSPKSREFLAITQAQNYYFTDLDGKSGYSCVNHNALLTMMEGALSGKTGFTGGAGYCYVGALESDGRKYVIALLGCGWPPHKAYKWSDARKLFKHGLETYRNEPLGEAPNPGFLPVLDGIPADGQIGHEAAAKLKTRPGDGEQAPQVLIKEGERVKASLSVPEQLCAPVKAGQQVGEIIYSLEGVRVYQEAVYAAEDVAKVNLGWCAGQTVAIFLQ